MYKNHIEIIFVTIRETTKPGMSILLVEAKSLGPMELGSAALTNMMMVNSYCSN